MHAQAILRTVLPVARPCEMVSGHAVLTLRFEDPRLAGRRWGMAETIGRRKQRGDKPAGRAGTVGEERV